MNTRVVKPKLDEKMSKGGDKLSGYKWKPAAGDRGKFRRIPKGDLFLDRSYQRDDVGEERVLRLASEWSWFDCGVLLCAKRGNRIFVVDGQHRLLAAMKRSDVTDLPCMACRSNGSTFEARGFVSSNTNRKTVSAHSKYKALLTAGDAAAASIDSVLKEHGILLTRSSLPRGPLHIRCIAQLFKLERQGSDHLLRVLVLAKKLVQAEGSFDIPDRLLKGLSYVHRRIDLDGGIDNEKLQERLLLVGVTKILRAMDNMAILKGKGGEAILGLGLLEAINKGLRIGYALK